MVDIKEAEKIIKEIKSGNWKEFIMLQTNPYREYYHAEVLKYVLYVLSKKENAIFSIDYIQNEMVYLVSLIRYFGKKPLNNGYYLRRKEDAENFVKQYREALTTNHFLEREEKEKIEIVGISSLLKENII